MNPNVTNTTGTVTGTTEWQQNVIMLYVVSIICSLACFAFCVVYVLLKSPQSRRRVQEYCCCHRDPINYSKVSGGAKVDEEDVLLDGDVDDDDDDDDDVDVAAEAAVDIPQNFAIEMSANEETVAASATKNVTEIISDDVPKIFE